MKLTKTKIDLALATGSLLGMKLVNYVVIALLARYIDMADMGRFFLASAIAVMISSATEAGLSQYMIRAISGRPLRGRVYLSDLVSMRIPIGFAMHAAAWVVVYFWKPEMAQIMALVSLFTILIDHFYSFSAYLLAMRRVGARTLAYMAGALAILVGGIISWYFRLPLTAVLWVYCGSHGLMLVVAVIAVWWRFGGIRLHWRPGRFVRVIRGSFMLGVNAMLSIVIYKADTIMLGAMIGDLAVAQYESAYKLFEVSRILVRPALMVFLPVAAAMVAAGQWPELKGLVRKLFLTAGGLGVLMALIVLAWASPLIVLAYGPAYASSAPVLQILFLTAPCLYLTFVATFLATAMHAERRVLTLMLACLMVNLGLNAVLIPRYGSLGAASATLASELMLCILLTFLVIKWLLHADKQDKDPTESTLDQPEGVEVA